MSRKRENTASVCETKSFSGVWRLSLCLLRRFNVWLLSLLGEIGYHFPQRLEQEFFAIRIESAFVPILLGQREGRNDDRVIQLRQRMIAAVLFRHRARFRIVHCQQTLVEMGLGRQHWLIAKQNMKKRKMGNVSSQNHDAHRERSR